MSDEYEIALAYSNIQELFGVPIVVSGVIINQADFSELEKRDLPSKRNLQQRKESLYELESTFDDVADYLTQYETSRITLPNDFQAEIENAYLKILRTLRSRHLLVISGEISSISIRCLENPIGWQPMSFSPSFIKEIKKLSHRISFFASGESERLLEVARILATLEYERLRSLKGEYLLNIVSKNRDSLVQLLKITWNSPPIEEFNNQDVGAPAIVIRRPNMSSIDFVRIDPKTTVSLTPIAKFCRGFQEGKEIARCKLATIENPFGQFILGSSSEQCWNCGQGQDYAECLYRPPRCNGYEVACKQEDFAGNICWGLFALYVTRFCNELKVGTAFLPNVIGRLLEQGPASALVLYPIDGIWNAHVFEKTVKEHLADILSQFENFGINEVYREAPPAEQKLSYFLQNWSKVDEQLMERIRQEISKLVVRLDEQEVDLSKAQWKICDFRLNYVIPPEKLLARYSELKPLFHPVKGVVVGMRGSFLFLDSGDILDAKRLQGYVARGKI